MTLYSESYKQRQPVAVDASSTGSGAVTPVDITIEIPPDWDLFWENIRSDFFDVVVVDNEGQLLTFDRAAGASYANRTLTLEVNAYRLTTQTVALIYVYFQNPSESSDLATTFTPSSALTGYIDLSRPTGLLVTQPLQRPPSSEPQTSFVKASTDQIDIYFAVSNLFGLRASSYNSRFGMEGLEHVVIQSFDNRLPHYHNRNPTNRYTVFDTNPRSITILGDKRCLCNLEDPHSLNTRKKQHTERRLQLQYQTV